MPRRNDSVNDTWMCDHGRLNYEYVQDEARLRRPQVRRDGKLVDCEWNEALAAVAGHLRRVAREGGQGIAALASPHLTNEENFRFAALLRAAGIPVYRIPTMFSTLASIEAHIRLLGYLSGEDERAVIEVRRFQDVIRRAASLKRPGAAPPRVMGFGGSYSYGSQTLFTDIMRVLGAENVAATHGLVGYDRVTDERIVQWNPDWIVAGADRGTVEQVHARLLASPAIASTNAARRGQVVVLEHHVFLPLSPFTARLVESIAEALYGDNRS
jgi:ABC-type Fe3+-hydroxamate transport system substrate-binding protein